MKKKIEVEVNFCDACGGQDAYYDCINCGKDFCYDCTDEKNPNRKCVEYFTGIYCGNHMHTCNDCDAELRASKNNPLFNALLTIKNLKMEEKHWCDEFKPRAEAAGKVVEKLVAKYDKDKRNVKQILGRVDSSSSNRNCLRTC